MDGYAKFSDLIGKLLIEVVQVFEFAAGFYSELTSFGMLALQQIEKSTLNFSSIPRTVERKFELMMVEHTLLG